MRFYPSFITTAALILGSTSALAQSIEVGQLGSAQAYEVGTLNSGNGGLDTALWQGTSAVRATALLDVVPKDGANEMAHTLLRAVILSGGVPPQGAPEELSAFRQSRINAIIEQGDMQAAQAITSRTPDLSGNTKLTSNLALLAGDIDRACGIADTVLENRGAPEWARLRAFCHVHRGETPAAELTADILRNTGYEDPVFFSLLRILSGGTGKPELKLLTQDPLYAAMLSTAAIEWPGPGRPPAALSARTALSSVTPPEKRLTALYAAGDALSDAQIVRVFNELGTDVENTDMLAGGGEVTLASALDAPVPLGTAQLFKIASEGQQSDRPKAISALLSRAEGAGALSRFSRLLTPQIQSLSPEEQAITDLTRFTHAAILRRDIGLLQKFYGLLADRPDVQTRIALAADALGYGFAGGQLGTDIEAGLKTKGDGHARAQRHAFMAMAMGAQPSDAVASQVMQFDKGKGKSASVGELALLTAAAQNGARAETALRAAIILHQGRPDDFTLYSVIHALNSAGLSGLAGQVAALEFWLDEQA